MGLIKVLLESPWTFILIAVPLLYAVIFHEVAHGLVAYRMGDPTAKNMGRLTFNPLKHLDPLGTLMLFIVGFGWARPVPVNFANLGDSRRALIAVSAAGVVTNMILAFVALFFLQLMKPLPGGVVATALTYFAYINIILAAFNLIPIPPLDGSKILMGFLPPRYQYSLLRLEPYGFFIIIGLLFLGVLRPVINFIFNILYGLIGFFIPV
ncbi:MAG: site-2 protease family protein [Syntrophales bacterium]|nr:site-2 protease family protein [Syntrophales bacterium]